MTARLQKWLYLASEALTPDRPVWLHRLVCNHCRGMDAYVREQEATR